MAIEHPGELGVKPTTNILFALGRSERPKERTSNGPSHTNYSTVNMDLVE